MNLERIKKDISKYLNQKHEFIYTGSRNQTENFVGKIIKLYPAIFIIETETGIIKSFVYSDFATGSLNIIS